MQKKKLLLLTVVSTMLSTSCSKLGPLSADQFTVTPNPLETKGGVVPATINGHFPEKYMNKKAVVTIIPELRYDNGERVKGTSATFQGENVADNNQTIAYRTGGNYMLKTDFAYADCNQAELYMTFDARLGSKQVTIPEVKVANGVIATSELYRRTVTTAQAALAPDAYQRITQKKQEANIKFLIQQANLRKSELKNNSVKEFVKMLKQINDDQERLRLQNVEVSAYTSPDGGFNINDKLANERQKVSEQYVNQELKKLKIDTNVDARYTAQDWDGFQQLVKASNIQDKDIILRVLSMYKDPQEREQQIKNISSAFRELADGILPQLRRSRLILNYEVIGRSDQQILDQIKADPKALSIEELLYAATLKQTPAEQETIYRLATTVYPNDARAYNNLATLAYARGDYETAKNLLAQTLRIDARQPEAKANQALLALQSGDVKTAELYIASATGANGLAEVTGNLNLAKGNYAQAEQDFGNSPSNSAALAQILNKHYAAAEATLKQIRQADAVTHYLRAITYTHLGNTTDAREALSKATSQDERLARYAEHDLELSR